MRSMRERIIIIIILLGLAFFVGIQLKGREKEVGLKIDKWDNLYNNKNIHVYYDIEDKQLLNDLKDRFKIQEITNGKIDELDKSIDIINWIKNNMKYSKSIKPFEGNKGAFDILEDKENKKEFSNKEICTVFNEFAIAAGIKSRIGELIVSNKEKVSDNDIFMVCEIWSDKHNKWIMIDPSNRIYITENNTPLSVIEVIKKGIDNLNIIELSKSKSYKKQMKKYFYAYAISIDNSIYSIKKSNSYLCFAKDMNEINIPSKALLNSPTIFTNDEHLFNLSPKVVHKISKNDDKPTLIFSRKNNTNNKDVKLSFLGGVFKNSEMVDKYYISINDGPFKEVNKYFDVDIKSGLNTIKLSQDGKIVSREVILEYSDK
ncbi:transglutaminase domain-containing protein [Clostridium sp. JNZ J1-5]